MSRRVFPIPVLGSLCLGLKGLSGCANPGDEPIIGDWVLAEQNGVEMPYSYSYEGYGGYEYAGFTGGYTQGGSLKIFEDLLGQFSMYYSVALERSYTYGETKINQSYFYTESYVTRVWVRPLSDQAGTFLSTKRSSYQIMSLDGGSLDCMLTSGSDFLECTMEDEHGYRDSGTMDTGAFRDTADTAHDYYKDTQIVFRRSGSSSDD